MNVVTRRNLTGLLSTTFLLSPTLAIGAASTAAPSATSSGSRINVANYVLSTDPDDTAAVQRAFAAAMVQMNQGQNVEIVFPAGQYSINPGSIGPLQVPRGVNADVHGEGRASVIDATAAGNGIVVQVIPAPSGSRPLADQVSSYVSVHDLVIQKGGSVQTGGDAIDMIGVNNSNSNGLDTVAIHGIVCLANGYAAAATNPWQTCVHITDPNFNSVWDIHNRDAGPANGESVQGTAVRVTQTGPGSTNYVDDSYYAGIQQEGGFALIWLDGHVEGTHITDSTAVGSTYGVYAPA